MNARFTYLGALWPLLVNQLSQAHLSSDGRL